MPRDPLRPRRDPVPPAPAVPGGYLRLAQPSLFWRAWELHQEDTLLARIERSGRRRYSVQSAAGTAEARFEGNRLLLPDLVARPADHGAILQSGKAAGGPLRLAYRSDEIAYPTLSDDAGPLALFGDLRGAGFAAEAKVWAADRFLAEGAESVASLAACILVLRDRPGAFR